MKIINFNKEFYKNLEVKKSNNGLGLFAKKDFKKNDIILEFIGKIISRDHFNKIKSKKIKKIIDDYSIQIDEDIFIVGTGKNKKIYDDFINHSCDPNSYVYINGNKVILIALKNIKQGEEITYDYSTTMYKDSWSIKCNCGSKICRKKIREFRFLPPKIKIKYFKLGILPDYIVKRYFKKS
ncbi:MAG: SET domain-containing protein-lysine N-methyltransferase [Candidatus Parcubacteria bacterium]|nr:MAG: SET domain-containing protein-lysine N-methyltransferase [Candidatus Parcubacteria bacterium]